MTRVVGNQDRNEFERDPLEAHRRGRRLDAMLRAPVSRTERGVIRATHRVLNELDDQRALEAARRLNRPA